MTDTDFLYEVLSDGRQHSHHEILTRSFRERGCGLTVHSRAADLRKRGFTVVCQLRFRDGRTVSSYQLLPQDSPSLNPAGLPSASPAVLSEEDPTAVGAADIPARRSLEQSHTASSLNPVQLTLDERSAA